METTSTSLDLFQLWQRSRDFFQSYDFQSAVSVLKFIGATATIVFGVLFVWVVLKMRKFFGEKAAELKMGLNPPVPGESKYDAKWKEIREHIGSVRETEWKFAVIEADKIIEEIFKGAGFPGETLGEQLTLLGPEQLASINELWSAHKIRNLIAHDPNYQVSHQQAREAIGNYEKTLNELGVLAR